MALLRKIAALSRKEVVLLLKAATLIGGIRIGLALFPFSKVQKWLNSSSERPDREMLDSSYPDQVVRAARAVARRTLGDKPCLLQALAVQWLLERAGYVTSLHIGVIKGEKDRLLAHAWLECDGEIIIGGRSSPSRYTALQPLQATHGAAITESFDQHDLTINSS